MSSSPSPFPQTHSLAILDDYPSLSPPIFAHHLSHLLSPSSSSPSSTPLPTLTISSFPTTLSPSHPSSLATLITRLKPYTIISTMRERTPFPSSLLTELPNLRLLLTTGMRNASIDLQAAKERGIVVAGTTGSRAADSIEGNWEPEPRLAGGEGEEEKERMKEFQPTAQHTWSLILALTSRVATDSPSLQHGSFTATPAPTTEPSTGSESEVGYEPWQTGFTLPLSGKVLGIVGLGKLGSQVARTGLLGFGMRIIAWSSSLTQSAADAAALSLGLPPGSFTVVEKEELFRSADVVSVHYVLSPRSVGVVGEKELAWMKKGAYLINTARGPLVDEDALYECLSRGGVGGVGLDVFWREPLEREGRWRGTAWGREGRSEVVMSPHMGYVSEEGLRGWYGEQAVNVRGWIERGVEGVENRMD